MDRESAPLPEPIAQLQRQLEQFRSTHPHRTKLPEPLWQTAVDLARQHGIYPVSHPLRLDYVGLKKRVAGKPNTRRPRSKPAFVELIAPASSLDGECMIEFESSAGHKMRIQWKAGKQPDWTSLLRAWREAER